MGKVANDPAETDRSLPVATAPLTEQPLVPAMTVARMLTLPALAGASVVAGLAGLERPVRRANVMEVPDIISWVRPESVLLTTGYPLRESGADLGALVAALDQRGVSALAIKLHRYLDELPASMLYQADRCGLPLVVVPDQVGFDDILTQVFAGVASERATLLERREDLHRQLVNAVLAGGGLDQVVAIVSELFGGLAMVTTA
ncbi:MAG: PucR family transcriptional regulator ligand-binding domain-containing protein, partial [Nocardioidaceae bacterium]